MTGEIAFGGVYFPALLLLGLAAFAITALASRLLAWIGFYRAIAYRLLVDLALFVLVLGLLVRLTAPSRPFAP